MSCSDTVHQKNTRLSHRSPKGAPSQGCLSLPGLPFNLWNKFPNTCQILVVLQGNLTQTTRGKLLRFSLQENPAPPPTRSSRGQELQNKAGLTGIDRAGINPKARSENPFPSL